MPEVATEASSEIESCSNPALANVQLANFETNTSDQAWYRFGAGVTAIRGTASNTSSSRHVLNVEFESSTGGAGIGLPLASVDTDNGPCPLNASRAFGVRFMARGTGPLRVAVGDVHDLPVSEGGECTRPGENCYDFPGLPIRLTEDWTTFDVPFCRMQPEGWGQQAHVVDTTQLMALQFRHQPGAETRFQLDEVSLYESSGGSSGTACAPACPLETVVNPEAFVPEETYLQLTDALTLHTFEQHTAVCGMLTRRYLEYRPTRLAPASNAPVVFALHGRESSAEGFQDFMTHGSFDERAEQTGAIVVYGNAAPGAHSSPNPNYLNTGTWRQGVNDDGQVDDVDYLRKVLDDMRRRGSISGSNPVYLVGHSSGGGMAVNAAFAVPELFRGVAPLFAYVGEQDPQVPALTQTSVREVLLVYAPNDPGLPTGHGARLTTLAASWATQIGVDEAAIANPQTLQLSNPIVEGGDYTGTLPIALATQDSSVTQLDFTATGSGARMRMLRIERGGHFLPHSLQDTDPAVLAEWGFRNQDFQIADAVWDFFILGTTSQSKW